MGYYTKYKLEYEPEYITGLESALNERIIVYGPLIDFVNGHADTCKWYDHEQDMREFSKRFPEVLFTLKGEGEESGDLWVKYFRDGKMQNCQARIDFPPFDEKELK